MSKAKIIKKKFSGAIIKIGTAELKIPMRELLLHRGVEKAVMNKVAPFAKRELNKVEHGNS